MKSNHQCSPDKLWYPYAFAFILFLVTFLLVSPCSYDHLNSCNNRILAALTIAMIVSIIGFIFGMFYHPEVRD